MKPDYGSTDALTPLRLRAEHLEYIVQYANRLHTTPVEAARALLEERIVPALAG